MTLKRLTTKAKIELEVMMFGFKREKKARTDHAFVHFEIGHVERRIEDRRGRAVLEKLGLIVSELAGGLKRKTNTTKAR